MISNIRNALNYVENGSFDRSPFTFKQTWMRTTISGAVCLIILLLSTTCAIHYMEPLLASGLFDHIYKPEAVVGAVVVCLLMYTVRDFLISYRADIVMNLRIAQANHWLSYGSFLNFDQNDDEPVSMGQMLLITSRAKDREDGLHVACLATLKGEPVLITAKFDSGCMILGVGYRTPEQIRSMLDEAAGKWRYNVAEGVGIEFGPDPTGNHIASAEHSQSRNLSQVPGPLSTPNSLSLAGRK
jgi:hypothetical protein